MGISIRRAITSRSAHQVPSLSSYYISLKLRKLDTGFSASLETYMHYIHVLLASQQSFTNTKVTWRHKAGSSAKREACQAFNKPLTFMIRRHWVVYLGDGSGSSTAVKPSRRARAHGPFIRASDRIPGSRVHAIGSMDDIKATSKIVAIVSCIHSISRHI